MKKTYFFLLSVIVAGLLCTSPIAAANLIQGGDMASSDSWLFPAFNTVGDVEAEWGYGTDGPASGSGAALHVKVTNVAGNSQYAFYQAVTLEAGKTYSLDAAVKIIGQYRTAWLEFYVGTINPVDRPDDYAAVEGEIVRVASYYSWQTSLTTHPHSNSTIQAGANSKSTYTPTETGTHYFLVKIGSNAAGSQEILLDNIMFGEGITFLPTKPVVTFESDRRVGFAPLTVNLQSTATNPESYEWTVSDGKSATTETTAFTFDQVGRYDVKLKVSNTIGYDTLMQRDFIQVMEPVQIHGGGVLEGGLMGSADESSWSVSTLTSPLDMGEPGQLSSLTTTWGYTGASMPTAGDGGALRVQIDANGADIVQYCFFQRVTLNDHAIYEFDAAYRDLSSNLWRNWTEVFISTTPPVNGNDFGTSNGTQIASLGNWETRTGLVRGMDGTFKLNATNRVGYTPEVTGDYYLVIKVGVQGNGADAASPLNSCDILLDEISLNEVNPKPYTDFSAENESGFSPLVVQFKNLTQYGETYEWNFGDGSAVSTAFEPTHTYTAIGDYTITLKASNAQGDSTLVKTAFVSVVESYELPDGEKLYGGDMTKGGFWKTTPYGQNLKAPTTWNYTAEPFTGSEGGVLRVQTGRIALYQRVEVKAGHIYKFDCDVHVKSSSTNMWVQTFMSEEEPPQDSDPLVAANTMAELRTYADGTVSGYAGKFSEKCIKGASYPFEKGVFKATVDEVRWFVIKFGTNSTMDVLLDNLSLKEEKAPVEPDFFADQTTGEAPFTVGFFDLSDGNPQSFEWDFGDGNTSTEQYPEHTYTVPGVYTISLTVTDENGNSATKTYDNYITVTGESGLSVLSVDFSLYVTDATICIESKSEALSEIRIYNIGGLLVEEAKTNDMSFRSKQLAAGVYIISVNGNRAKVVVK